MLKKGEVGYRIGHKKQVGGRGSFANIWTVGADHLSREKLNTKNARYWLFAVCHEGGKYTMGFYEVSGSRGICKHLRAEHGLDKNLDDIGLRLRLRQIASLPQCSTYPSTSILASNSSLSSHCYIGSSFRRSRSRQATSKLTVALCQLLRPHPQPLISFFGPLLCLRSYKRTMCAV